MVLTFAVMALFLLYHGQAEKFPEKLEKEKWLDFNGNYLLRWTISREEQIAYMIAEVSTHGYVGFGLSHHGSMRDSDIVIGGIFPNGTTYLSVSFSVLLLI